MDDRRGQGCETVPCCNNFASRRQVGKHPLGPNLRRKRLNEACAAATAKRVVPRTDLFAVSTWQPGFGDCTMRVDRGVRNVHASSVRLPHSERSV